MAFVREKHLRGLFLSPKSTAAVKSDQSSRGTAQPVSWHLRAKKRREGTKEEEEEKKERGSMSGWEGRKTQLLLCLSHMLLLKEREGVEAGERER